MPTFFPIVVQGTGDGEWLAAVAICVMGLYFSQLSHQLRFGIAAGKRRTCAMRLTQMYNLDCVGGSFWVAYRSRAVLSIAHTAKREA